MKKSKLRMLVVDDDPFVLKVMEHMLAKLGFNTVATCKTGTSALDMLDLQEEPSN